MNILNLMYILLMIYFLTFINEIIKLYKISSYKALFKSSYINDKSFAISIFSIIFKAFLIPALGFLSIYISYKNLQTSIQILFSESKYYYDPYAVSWLKVIFNGDMTSFNITNLDLLSNISSELFFFKVLALIFIIATLSAQLKLFDKRNLGIFEEGLVINGAIFDWDKVLSINELTSKSGSKDGNKVILEILVLKHSILKDLIPSKKHSINLNIDDSNGDLYHRSKEPNEVVKTLKINISKHSYDEFSYVLKNLGYKVHPKHAS